MADENARQILKTALSDFDNDHLKRVLVAAYDRWNWDTNSDTDKHWFEVAEEILKDRGMLVTITSRASEGVSFSNGTGKSFPVVSVNPNNDVVLGTYDAIKVTNVNDGANIEYEVLTVAGNALHIGWELKKALVDFMVTEMVTGSTQSSSGTNVRDTLENTAIEAVKQRL